MIHRLLLAALFALNLPVHAEDLREQRLREYFGKDLKNLILQSGQGRLQVHSDSFSRYVFTRDTADQSSPTILIPLATSRDESQNIPDVLFFIPGVDKPERKKLSEFLVEEVFRKISTNGMIDVYRGAERDDERSSWENRIPARGARYWTPDANYAWRYARKQSNFLDETLAGRSPVLHFRLSLKEFEQKVRSGSCILGAELPATIHKRLERGQGFTDHLASGQLYLGYPSLGVEVEIHTGRERSSFAEGYVGSLSLKQLKAAREDQIERGYARAVKQWPKEKQRIENEKIQRLTQTIYEVTNNDFKMFCESMLVEE